MKWSWPEGLNELYRGGGAGRVTKLWGYFDVEIIEWLRDWSRTPRVPGLNTTACKNLVILYDWLRLSCVVQIASEPTDGQLNRPLQSRFVEISGSDFFFTEPDAILLHAIHLGNDLNDRHRHFSSFCWTFVCCIWPYLLSLEALKSGAARRFYFASVDESNHCSAVVGNDFSKILRR